MLFLSPWNQQFTSAIKNLIDSSLKSRDSPRQFNSTIIIQKKEKEERVFEGLAEDKRIDSLVKKIEEENIKEELNSPRHQAPKRK